MIEEVSGSHTEDTAEDPQEKTVTKKKLKVLGPDNFGMWYTGFENGGELPKRFKNNRFTKKVLADQAVEEYNQGI